MTKKEKQKARFRRLEQELTGLERRLLRELQRHLSNVRNISADDPTELFDMASEGELDYMSAVSAEAGSDTVREIQEALLKLRDGSYGICADCGRRISQRRLKARPFATRCIECKLQQERQRYAGSPTAYARVDSHAPVDPNDDQQPDLAGEFSDVLRELDNVELQEMF